MSRSNRDNNGDNEARVDERELPTAGRRVNAAAAT